MAIEIPSEPTAFFTEFFPAQYEKTPRLPRADTAAKAAFEVIGDGAWSFAVQGGKLKVEEGISPETAIQVGVSRRDFDGLFIERTRVAVARTGAIPAELMDVFRPLFVDEKKKHVATSAHGTVRVHLEEGGRTYDLSVTPGRGKATEPRTTVGMSLDDFLALVSGKKHLAGLLLRGHLRVRGEKTYALKLTGLLGL